MPANVYAGSFVDPIKWAFVWENNLSNVGVRLGIRLWCYELDSRKGA